MLTFFTSCYFLGISVGLLRLTQPFLGIPQDVIGAVLLVCVREERVRGLSV
jgi:hypothetical protein